MRKSGIIERIEFWEEQLSEYAKHRCYIWATPEGGKFSGTPYPGCYLIEGDRERLEIIQIITITPSGDYRDADCLLVAIRQDGVWDLEPPLCLKNALEFIDYSWKHCAISSMVW